MGREIPVQINKEPWTIKYTNKIRSVRGNLLKYLGLCVYRTRTLWIRSHQTKDAELNTVIHETLHAHLPDFAESSIKEMADELTAILKACGLA